MVLFPRIRVYTLVIIVIFIRILPLPAWLLPGYWFAVQLLLGATAGAAGGAGVAFRARARMIAPTEERTRM